MRKRLCPLFFFGLILSTLFLWMPTKTLYAQTATPTPVSCNAFIQNLQLAIEKCNDINNNWTCYGNFEAAITPSELRFDLLGDRHPMAMVDTLGTTDAGIVMMYLNERGMGDPVIVMAYGDVVLKPLGPHEFNLSLTNPNVQCEQIAGAFVYTEEHQQGVVTVNGVMVNLLSTVFITMRNDGEIFFVNVEGQVRLTISTTGQLINLPEGQAVRVELGSNGLPIGVVGDPQPVAEFDLPYNPAIVDEVINTDQGIKRVHNSNRSVDIEAPITRMAPAGTQPISSTLPTERLLWDREAPSCGGRIEIGDMVLSDLDTLDQECLYTFCANQGDPISISMIAENGAALDTWFDVRGPDNEFWKYHNDISRTSRDSLICNRALPRTGCYTIVTRSAQNNSQGRFALALAGSSLCQEPEPQCQVMPNQGLNVRTQPDLNASVEVALPPGSRMKPLGRSSDGQWLRVDAIDVGRSGWVNVNRQHFICEIPIIDLPIITGEIATQESDGEVGAAAAPTTTATPTPGICLGVQCEQLPMEDHPTAQSPDEPDVPSPTPTPTPSKLDTPFGTP